MSKSAVTQVFERSRPSPPVPEPMWGWCICRQIKIEKEGSLYVATAGMSAMDTLPEQHAGYYRLQVVKTSPEYLPPAAMNPQNTPFGPGAYVQPKPDLEIVKESYPIMLPDGYVAMTIRSVSAWRPGRLADNDERLDS